MKCLVTALFPALALLGWLPGILSSGETPADVDRFYEEDFNLAADPVAEVGESSSFRNGSEISRYDYYYYYRHRVYESTVDRDAKITVKPFVLPQWVVLSLKAWIGFPAIDSIRWVADVSRQRLISLKVMANKPNYTSGGSLVARAIEDLMPGARELIRYDALYKTGRKSFKGNEIRMPMPQGRVFPSLPKRNFPSEGDINDSPRRIPPLQGFPMTIGRNCFNSGVFCLANALPVD